MADEFPDLDLGQTIRGFNAGQKVFWRYSLVRILGRGGMGVVWLARDEKLDRDVALKFLPELIVHDAAVLDELKRETKRSLELTHHNIVRIYDFADDDQSACISMEYVDGATLSALRVQQPNKVFETADIGAWIEQTCEALEYAHHRAKIVHRDLKPANLMLNSKGELKVADFGIARSLTDSVSMLTMARGTSGTLVYMSPQQIDGKRASHLDDIYSLGATIYELLSGKPPFYSGAVEHQIRELSPPSMSERRDELGVTGNAIPPVWEQTIVACLAKHPAQRPQSASQVAQMLGLKSTSYATTPVVPPKAPTKPIVKTHRKPLLITGSIAALLLLAVGSFFISRYWNAPVTAVLPQATPVSSIASQSTVAPSASPEIAVATSPAASVEPSIQPPSASTDVAAAASPGASVEPSVQPSATIAPVTTGAIVVTTKPKGATITIADQTGKSPETLSGIKVGKQTIKIVLDGFEPLEREIEIKGNEKLDLGELALERSRGSAEVKSKPKGIAFELIDSDGTHHKGKTPATIEKVSVGSANLVFNPKSSSKHEEQLLIQRRRTASITWESLDESRSVPSAAQNTPNGANSPASKPASVFAGKWKEIAIVGSAVGRVSDKIMKEGSNRRFSVNGDETQWDLVGGNQPAKIIAKQGRTFTAIDHDHTDPKRWQSRMEFTVSSDGKTAHSRTVTKWKDHSTELDQIDWRKTE